MLKNYLKIGLRTLTKHPGYTLINVLGLAVGIACCVLMMQFARTEWSYDRFHEKADRIYRAWVQEDYGEDEQFFNTVTPLPLGPALAASFPEVEQAVRVERFAVQVRKEDAEASEPAYFADPAFFDVFDFSLLQGDPATALAEPNSLVLTQEAALRYFGDADPLGQTLSVQVGDTFRDVLVTGVAAVPPPNSSIRFSLLMPFEVTRAVYSDRAFQSWFNVYAETYVLLRRGTGADVVQAKLPSMVEQVLGDDYQPGTYVVGLQPLTDIHLNPDVPQGIAPVSDPAYAAMLAVIAVLVLAIACINFVMLAVGRSVGRAREVGVRKAVGAQRAQLMAQFWGEALVLAGGALALGFALAHVALPYFNELVAQDLALPLDFGTLGGLALLMVVIGLVAGSYPALILSGFRPTDVLKGQVRVRGDRSWVRRGLVVVQFGFAVFLIIGTLAVGRQLRYMQEANLGFEAEQVVVIPLRDAPSPERGLAEIWEDGVRTAAVLRGELADQPGIVDLTVVGHAPGGPGWTQIGFDTDQDTYRQVRLNLIDAAYLETFGIDLVEGRDADAENPADASRAVLVNEAMAQVMGANVVGERLPGPRFGDHEIVGVVEDFHYASLHTAVEPLVLALHPDPIFEGVANVGFAEFPVPKIAVRLQGYDLPATMDALEAVWERAVPTSPFDYAFLDQTLDSQYRYEERLGQIVRTASLLAILIACFGLFGLATLAAARRTKEIGVRKVLGASASGVALLLARDFAVLVGLGGLLAVPFAYVAVRQWLSDFAYQAAVGPGLFLGAIAGVLAIALLAVSYRAAKAALADPVHALRYE